MAQLKLSLSDVDADAIRRLASERGLGISAYVRDVVLGSEEVELAPNSLQRLDRADAALRLIKERVERVEQQSAGLDPSDQIEALDRRLGRLEEMAGL